MLTGLHPPAHGVRDNCAFVLPPDIPTLAEALAAFEDGVNLTRRCAGQLEDAERRIEVLVREGEKWISRPFEESEESE
ncbi:MAG: exodeoxyribonuclease VII small subunit [Myxococcota bacterium]